MFEELMAVVRELREKCPWDRKQTVASARPLALNEAYELDEALGSGDAGRIAEELGDYLFVGLFLADLVSQEHGVELKEVLGTIVAKLKRRHPHVYGDTEVAGADEVLRNWEQIKRQEKGGAEGSESILDSVPRALPALKQAQLVQERCRRVGFDWDRADQVLEKVAEEVEELKEEVRTGKSGAGTPGPSDPHSLRVQEEFGDLLFALVNLSRHLGIDSENALREATAKFGRRFRALEAELARQGRAPQDCSLEELDRVWESMKRRPDADGEV